MESRCPENWAKTVRVTNHVHASAWHSACYILLSISKTLLNEWLNKESRALLQNLL